MAKKGKKIENDKHAADWAKARKVCRLNAETIRMAKQLGMSPKSLIKNKPSPSQRWKAPVHEWVRALYFKRFPPKACLPFASGSRALCEEEAPLSDAAEHLDAQLPDELLEEFYGKDSGFS